MQLSPQNINLEWQTFRYCPQGQAGGEGDKGGQGCSWQVATRSVQAWAGPGPSPSPAHVRPKCTEKARMKPV